MGRSDRVRSRRRASSSTCTGIVVTVDSHRVARRIRDRFDGREELALHQLRVLGSRAEAARPERVATKWARTRRQALRMGATDDQVDELDRLVHGASPLGAAVLLLAVDLCIADTGFVLAVIDPDRAAGATGPVVDAVSRIFGRTVVEAGSADRVFTRALVRPDPERLERSVDRDLLSAILDRGDEAPAAWARYRARTTIDDAPGFGSVAPMLFERSSRLGLDDEDLPRIRGVRHRTWYHAQLLVHDAAEAVTALRATGCDPVLIGDLVAAVAAAERGAVRPARSVDLLVPPSDAARASATLVGRGWERQGVEPVGEALLARQSSAPFHRGPGRVLRLHWRALPQHAARLVDADDRSGRVVLHGTEIPVPGPTTQLLRLWARTGDPDPGHAMHTVCATADLATRRGDEGDEGDEVDWTRLRRDCERLELVEYGDWYVGALPGTESGVAPCGW